MPMAPETGPASIGAQKDEPPKPRRFLLPVQGGVGQTGGSWVIAVRRFLAETWSWIQAAGSLVAAIAGFLGLALLVINPKAGVILLSLGVIGYMINTYSK